MSSTPRSFPVFSFFLLVLAVTAFLLSLLAVLPAPLNILWKASIAVMEAGYFLAIPCLLLAGLGFRGPGGARGFGAGFLGKTAALLFLLAALLFASPLVRAVRTVARLAKTAPPFLTQVEGESFRTAPLVWRDLAFGIDIPSAPSKTLTYARKGDDSLALDFYPAFSPRQAGGGGAPCVVFVHGGGWNSGNRRDLPALHAWLASKGYAVAAIEYRLAPRHLYPAPIEDVRDALEFLKRNATALGIDASRFVLAGRSAGGQVALQAAYTLHDTAVRGAIGFYAPADMVLGYSLPGNPRILDSRAVMDAYLGGSCFQHPEKCRESSPLEFADAQSPPTLLLHGTADVMVSPWHTRHLEDKLERLGVPHFTVDLPWATHGYDYVFSGPGSQIGLYYIERFLAAVAP